jgi:hypothetical protein
MTAIVTSRRTRAAQKVSTADDRGQRKIGETPAEVGSQKVLCGV